MPTPAFIIEHPDRFPQSGSTQLSNTERKYAYHEAFDDTRLAERHLAYGNLGKDLLCPPSPKPNESPNFTSDFPERFRAAIQGVPNMKADIANAAIKIGNIAAIAVVYNVHE